MRKPSNTADLQMLFSKNNSAQHHHRATKDEVCFLPLYLLDFMIKQCTMFIAMIAWFIKFLTFQRYSFCSSCVWVNPADSQETLPGIGGIGVTSHPNAMGETRHLSSHRIVTSEAMSPAYGVMSWDVMGTIMKWPWNNPWNDHQPGVRRTPSTAQTRKQAGYTPAITLFIKACMKSCAAISPRPKPIQRANVTELLLGGICWTTSGGSEIRASATYTIITYRALFFILGILSTFKHRFNHI